VVVREQTEKSIIYKTGCIVDQPFQPWLSEGMIRCYMSKDMVVGFGHQLIKALMTPPQDGRDSTAA